MGITGRIHRPIQSLGFLLALEPLAPDRGLLLGEGREERDRLLDSLGLAGQTEEDLLEDALIEGLSELLVVRSAVLEAEEEVDLGAGGGHVGLDQEGLEANEVGDHVEDEFGSRISRLLPSALLVLLLPELRVLQVLVSSRGHLHAELQAFLYLHLVQQFPVLYVPALDLGYELLVGLGPQRGVEARDGLVLLAVDELQGSVYEVAQVGQQFVVVLIHEVLPRELGVALLGSVDQQIIPPYFTRNLAFQLDRMRAEHSRAVPLGKLAALVVEVLGGRDMVEERPALARGDEAGGEDDGVEGHVVLAHELEELDVVVDPPILVVFLQQVGSDGDVADRSIKPHIEHLLLELFDRHGHAPLQVAGDALRLQAHVRPGLRDRDRVLRPLALLRGRVDPFLELVLDLGQVDEEVHGGPHLGLFLADEAEVVDQFRRGIEGLLALVALVAPCVWELAEGAGADDEPIGEPEVAVRAVALHHLLLRGHVLLVDVQEDLLRDLGVPLGAGPSEVVKSDVEPLVHVRVDLEVVVAYLLRSLLLLPRLHLGCSAVLVSSADVEHVRPLKLLEPREDVGREHAADDVAEMWDVVDIGQCGCDQDVVLVLGRQFGVGLVDDLLRLELFLMLFVDFNFLRFGLSILRDFLGGCSGLALLLLCQRLLLLLLGRQPLFQLPQLLFGKAHSLALRQRFRVFLVALLLVLSLLLDLLLLLLLFHRLILLYLSLHILKIIRIYKRNEQSSPSLIFGIEAVWSFLTVFLVLEWVSYNGVWTVELYFKMGKQFQEARGGSFQQRGSFGGRGAPRGRGGFNNNRGGFDQGPPSYVIPYGTFLHKSENTFVVKCTDMTRFPKFNRGVYLENKSKVGSVDEILGPLNAFYFSVKPAEGVNPTSFKEGQVFYMSPEDLLSTDRFTRPQTARPKGPPRTGGAGGRGGFGGDRGRGGFGGDRGRGGFGGRGGPGGFSRGRGAPRGRGSFQR